MTDVLTEFLIDAQRRIAEKEGIPFTVARRGYSSVGAILLKINLLNGTSRVLTRIRIDDDLVWSPVSKSDPMDEQSAEAYLQKQSTIDPDLWIIEIEDRQGRHWFPGKVIA